MSRLRFACTLAIGALIASTPSLAQDAMDASSHAAPHAPALANPSDLRYRGEVRKVDTKKGKVTLRHGPITDLGMTAMTMEYLAADKALLKGLYVGEKVQFKAERLHGAFVLTGIAKAQ